MKLFGNMDVAFRYLSNALAQTHDVTAFLTLNLKICFCVVSTYQLSVTNAIVCGSMHAAECQQKHTNQASGGSGACIALGERETSLRKKITYRKSAWSKRKVEDDKRVPLFLPATSRRNCARQTYTQKASLLDKNKQDVLGIISYSVKITYRLK